MGTVYPKILKKLLAELSEYRRDRKEIAWLQSVLDGAMGHLVSVEDRELRRLIGRADAEIGVMRFMKPESEHYSVSLTFVKQIEDAIREALDESV